MDSNTQVFILERAKSILSELLMHLGLFKKAFLMDTDL